MPSYLSAAPEALWYLLHLTLWAVPIAALQWAVAPRVLARHWRELALVPAALALYLIATDAVAVRFGVWHFDPRFILGWRPLGVPIEEWLFFYLTSLIVCQSWLLFLPERLRRPEGRGRAPGADDA